MLGEAVAGQKQYAAAEPLLLQGYEGMRKREAKIPATSHSMAQYRIRKDTCELVNRFGENARARFCASGRSQ